MRTLDASVLALAAAGALLAGTAPLRADPVEPPPEVAEGADHEMEPDDSLALGEVELGLGFSGNGRVAERRRRVRFAESDLSGTVREGREDPLSGGTFQARLGGGDLGAGKIAPRWSRGLLLGSPGDPWQRALVDPVTRTRGRTGEGAWYRHDRAAVEMLAGRFARRDLAGLRGARGAVSAGLIAGHRGLQSSLGVEGGGGAFEAALDRSGAWRGEGLLRRAAGAWEVAACVRGGSAGFRSLAEPQRSGPARALTFGAAGDTPLGAVSVLVAAWRYRSGRAGARLAFEIERSLPAGATLVTGFEEQHGVRGELRRTDGFRQGGWIEWGRVARPLGVSLRHETWGARAGLRDAVRSVTAVRIEARMPGGLTAALGHCVFRVRRGESLYLREAESDRLALRALAGEGQRTRLEARVALPRGVVRATWQMAAVAGRRDTHRWTVEWTRRARSPARPP